MLSPRQKKNRDQRQKGAPKRIGGGSGKRRLSGLDSSRNEARRERADTNARDSSSPQIGKPPALRRQDARSDVERSKPDKTKDLKPKIDLGKGRTIYPVVQGGKVVYLPARGDASDFEIESGAFVEDDATRNEPVNTIEPPSKFDRPTRKEPRTGRTLFATTTQKRNGKIDTEYLPRQSEATPLELSAGKYVPEADPIDWEAKEEIPPKIDPDNPDRKLFATEAPDGSIEYFPKKNQATAQELAEGLYLEGIAAKDPVNQLADPANFKHPTIREANTGRHLFATTTTRLGIKATEYLPRQSEATRQELEAGKYIPEQSSRVKDVLDDPPETDPKNPDRKLFAVELADGSTDYFPTKNQATAQELAAGRYLDIEGPVSQKDPVNPLKDPSELGDKPATTIDSRTQRTLFATSLLNDKGEEQKIEYLPRKSEATPAELSAGKYIPEAEPIDWETLDRPPKTDPNNRDRKLFATQAPDGSVQYFPKRNQATAKELAEGEFLEGFTPNLANELKDPSEFKHPTVKEARTGRTLFATQTKWLGFNKTEYLPRQSDATFQELRAGKYIPEEDSIVQTLLDKRPQYDFDRQRSLFAVIGTDGRTEYLPKWSQATARELASGRYVPDDAIRQNVPLGPGNAMSSAAPRFDVESDRKVFAVTTPAGETRYLPRESQATTREKTEGAFIPDDVVDDYENKRLRTALRDRSAERALRRARRAAGRPGGVSRRSPNALPKPVRQARDGTDLWDGFRIPEVSEAKQREALENLHPQWELERDRMLYPAETADGTVAYLPLAGDASPLERKLGRYAALVPSEPLEVFLQQDEIATDIAPRTFETDRGEVRAYALADIEEAFERSPQLVLRSAQFVRDEVRDVSELQQQLSGV